jgi:glycosyltransferase involved in cell wall biosynthesis
MRIMLVPNSFLPAIGGLEITVARLAVELARQGHGVSVVTPSTPRRVCEEEPLEGIAVFRLPLCVPRLVRAAGARAFAASFGRLLLSPVMGLAALARFRQILVRLKPDVVNLHYIGENAVLCYLAGLPEGCRLVVSVHGNDIERYADRSRLSRYVTRVTLRMADQVLANSRAMLAKTIEIEPSVVGKASVMPNGVDLLEFDQKARFEHPRRYVLCIGNLVPKKGQDILIRAFELLRRGHADVDLLLAGDGRERGRCERLAAELGLGKAVRFLGAVCRDRIPELLAGTEMLVLPSRQEPFGIVLLEAMAAGKPIVATVVGGVPELVRDGKNGLLVNPEDPQALSEAICVLLEDTHLAERLGGEGRDLAQDYRWDAVAQRYIAIYEEAIA